MVLSRHALPFSHTNTPFIPRAFFFFFVNSYTIYCVCLTELTEPVPFPKCTWCDVTQFNAKPTCETQIGFTCSVPLLNKREDNHRGRYMWGNVRQKQEKKTHNLLCFQSIKHPPFTKFCICRGKGEKKKDDTHHASSHKHHFGLRKTYRLILSHSLLLSHNF